jgi:integrase
MAKTSQRLSALKISGLSGTGYFADGANLYFRVAPGGARGWMFRYTVNGRTRDMGLGPYPGISLAAARKLADKARELVKQGVDPVEHRRAERAAQRVASARTLTFDECARAYIADHESGWRNAKHRAQWASTLRDYASPIFGKLPVSAIDSGLVMRALRPIWKAKPETASRVRGRIESVLDWARVHGYRSGENPARWKGNIDHLLPPRSKVQRVTHLAALPYAEMGAFMAALRTRDELASLALQFVVLTAARSGEALGATWDEIDFNGKTWAIPGERMKAGKDHRVPLSAAALAILERLHDGRDGHFIFSGAKQGRPLSDMALLMLLRRMERDDITVHGFRSSFRDWVAEQTDYPREAAELALAHTIGSAVEAAYRRGDLLEKRRRLMGAWADYCGGARVGAKILPLRNRLSASPRAGGN